MWDFKNESGHPAAGANNAAGHIAGGRPFYFLGRESDNAYKRNVIKTSAGWVRRQHGPGTRVRDEILVAAGDKITTGSADIAEIYLTNANNVTYDTAVARGDTTWSARADDVYLNVVFNEEIQFKGGNSGNNLSITSANTISGNHAVWVCNSNPVANLPGNANNTLKFHSAGVGVDGTYQVNAQSITVVGGGHSVLSWGNTSIATARYANLVITGAVSNNMSTFVVGPGIA
jgi:hypothetical protein